MRQVVIDIETTGFSPLRGDRIIEIGAVSIEDGRISREFHALIDPGCHIPWAAQQIHGISEDMLCGQPRPKETWPKFREFIFDSALVAHNAPFDMGFLRHEFSRLGLGLTNHCHCTLKLSRKTFSGLPNYRLATVAKHLFGRLNEQEQLHRALADARLTARVWMALQQAGQD